MDPIQAVQDMYTQIIEAINDSLAPPIGTALIVALVSLGIFGTTGATILGIVIGLCFLKELFETALWALGIEMQQFSSNFKLLLPKLQNIKIGKI